MVSAPPVIRNAVAADIPALREIFRRASLSNDGDRDTLLKNPDALEFSAASANEERTRVAVIEGRAVGFATVVGEGGTLELDDLFVEPERMRTGIGRALVLDAVTCARRLGGRRLEVTANPHALGFYDALGFEFDHQVETRFGPAPRMFLDIL